MSKREEETDLGETGRQKERCTNQRTEEAEAKTHAGRQAERERKQDGGRGGGVVAGRWGGGGTGLHEVGAVWGPVWPILGPEL